MRTEKAQEMSVSSDTNIATVLYDIMGIFLVNKRIMKVNGLKMFHFQYYFPNITGLKCAFNTLPLISFLINI